MKIILSVKPVSEGVEISGSNLVVTESTFLVAMQKFAEALQNQWLAEIYPKESEEKNVQSYN